MKHLFNLTSWMFLTILALTACGKSEKSQSEDDNVIILKPETTEVSGDMEGCFTVVERDYKVTLEQFLGGVLTVELKRTDETLPFIEDGRELYHYGQYSASPYIQVGFGIELLDEDGNIVDKISASSSGLGGPYSPDECVELVKLSEGKTGSIRFSINDDAKNAVKFRITSAFTYGGSENDDAVTVVNENDDDEINDFESSDEPSLSNTSASNDNGKSENWDNVLSAYEKFADKYERVIKGVNDGSITISSPEYLECVQEANEFNQKLMNAKGDMSATQIARLNKTAQKIANALKQLK